MSFSSMQSLQHHFSSVAKKWITDFKISPTPLTEAQVLALPQQDQSKIWSSMQDWVSASQEIDGREIEYRYGFPLIPGYSPGSDDYYLGESTPETDNSVTFLELRVLCDECAGYGTDEEGEECEGCEGEGEMILELDMNSGLFEE